MATFVQCHQSATGNIRFVAAFLMGIFILWGALTQYVPARSLARSARKLFRSFALF